MHYNWSEMLSYNSVEKSLILFDKKNKIKRDHYCDENSDYIIQDTDESFCLHDFSSFTKNSKRISHLQKEIINFCKVNKYFKSLKHKINNFHLKIWDDEQTNNSDNDSDNNSSDNNSSDNNESEINVINSCIAYYIDVSSYINENICIEYFKIRYVERNQRIFDGSLLDGKDVICIYKIDDLKKFCVVACDGHPWLETSQFIHCNSDGSGPDIECNISDPKDIYNKLKKYAREFSQNKYH